MPVGHIHQYPDNLFNMGLYSQLALMEIIEYSGIGGTQSIYFTGTIINAIVWDETDDKYFWVNSNWSMLVDRFACRAYEINGFGAANSNSGNCIQFNGVYSVSGDLNVDEHEYHMLVFGILDLDALPTYTRAQPARHSHNGAKLDGYQVYFGAGGYAGDGVAGRVINGDNDLGYRAYCGSVFAIEKNSFDFYISPSGTERDTAVNVDNDLHKAQHNGVGASTFTAALRDYPTSKQKLIYPALGDDELNDAAKNYLWFSIWAQEVDSIWPSGPIKHMMPAGHSHPIALPDTSMCSGVQHVKDGGGGYSFSFYGLKKSPIRAAFCISLDDTYAYLWCPEITGDNTKSLDLMNDFQPVANQFYIENNAGTSSQFLAHGANNAAINGDDYLLILLWHSGGNYYG